MSYILNLFRMYKWELIGLSLLFFILAINHFPEGHIIIGGDVIQPVEMMKNYGFYFYEWSGRVSLFYGIFYLLDWFHISETAQLSWYLGLFLIGAYTSFLAFCSLILPQSSRLIRVLVSLFYATNIYTLYIFTATWGFTSYQILYVFIPVLTGLYIRSFQPKSSRYVVLFLLFSFLTSTSFGNPAFALSLGIYFLVLTILLLVFKWMPLDKTVFIKTSLMAIGALLLNAYWVLPILPQMSAGIQEINASQSIDLSEALRKTSNSIFDTVRLLPTSEQNKYYPTNFPYPSFSWMKKVIAFLAFIPFIYILFAYIRKKDAYTSKLYKIFFVLLCIFIALVARERFPFATMNNFLFHLPGLNTLRGWDKLAIFTPFIMSTLVFMALLLQQEKKYFKMYAFVCFVVMVLLALPFYFGGIQTEMSYILSNQKAKNFQIAKQSTLIKIPEPYYAVDHIFEDDKSDYKISMLPYSSGSSIGRVNLPDLKINGPHMARVLYGKPFIELTEPYFPGWDFAEDFEKTEINPEWIIDLYGLMGIKYVFYHKDAKPKSLEKFENSRLYLELSGAISSIDDNESFVLYQINENKIFPYVYATSSTDISVNFDPQDFSETVHDFRREISSIKYMRTNIKKTSLSVDVLTMNSRVFLSEKYDPLWKAEYITVDGKKNSLQRDESVKYANAWKVEELLSGGRIEIYYSPLKFFSIGFWISGITLCFVSVWAISLVARRRYNS